jgi:hypothetical protein
VVLGAAMTAVITWYRAPMDRLTGHLEHNIYDFEGLVLTAYILCAFGFAVLAGLLPRRSIPAMVAAFVPWLPIRRCPLWAQPPASANAPGGLPHLRGSGVVEHLVRSRPERLESRIGLGVDHLVRPAVQNQVSPAQGGAQQGLGRVHGRPGRDGVGVGAVQIAERDAVEGDLRVVHGQLQLTGSLVQADGTLVAVWGAH